MKKIPFVLLKIPIRVACEMWVSDSDCIRYMTDNQSHFRDFVQRDGRIYVGNNATIKSYNCGIVKPQTVVKHLKLYITLYNVTCAPGNMFNLRSVSKIQKNNFCVIADKDPGDPRRYVVKRFEKILWCDQDCYSRDKQRLL